jgi:OmcA/MtrC family decaheme c-type cytochrome
LNQFVGSRDVRFVLAYLDGSGAAKSTPVGQFVNYVVDAGNGQATYDHNLSAGLTQNEDGTITYKMETALPEDYDTSATHQVGSQFTRTHPVTGAAYNANAIFTFRPDGGMVTATREIVTTETCNKCHTQLSVHGRRREVQYCILCHTPQSVDPESGNSVDFPEIIHKIHMGADLPSVVGDPDADPPVPGEPYQIVGYRNSVHDYSTVEFPQDVTNCTVCHDEAAAPHADAYALNPTLEACGTCHDRTWFGTEDAPAG